VWRDDADHVRDVVVEFLADRQQPGAVVRAPDDRVAAQLTAEDFDLGFEEADAGVPARGTGFNKEIQSNVESAQHGL
jgi:hypothetical protein